MCLATPLREDGYLAMHRLCMYLLPPQVIYVPPVTTFSSTLTQALLKDSPIREIFGGQLYCSVHRHGTKESVVVEPFFSLQLDLQVRLTRIVIIAVPIHPSSSPPHVHTHTLLPLCLSPPPPQKKKPRYVKSEEVRTVQQALDSLVTREVVNMSTGSEAEVSTLVSHTTISCYIQLLL